MYSSLAYKLKNTDTARKITNSEPASAEEHVHPLDNCRQSNPDQKLQNSIVKYTIIRTFPKIKTCSN